MRRRWWGASGRLRRSRGFGIHSPFAYDLLVNTLKSHDAYYAYGYIDSMTDKERRRMKLLLRLLCSLKPASLRVSGELSEQVERIARSCDSSIEITVSEPQMLVLTPGFDREAFNAALQCVAAGGTAVVWDLRKSRAHAAALMERMTCGMTFSNGRMLIAVGRHDLPRQHFELYF